MQAHITKRLPRSLLLFGLPNVLLLVISIALALRLTHHRGKPIDRLLAFLSPLSSAPPWIYGIVLAVLAFQIPPLRFLASRFRSWPEEFRLEYLPLVLRQMLLPAMSIFLSKIAQSVLFWRGVFLLHYDEDYVELGRAKGIGARLLERRYIARPAMPHVITNYALVLVSLWQELIILETLFQVEGIGSLLVAALGRFDTPMVLALVVTFAYLIAGTVFVLDLVYAALDPRVRIGKEARHSVSAPRRTRQPRRRVARTRHFRIGSVLRERGRCGGGGRTRVTCIALPKTLARSGSTSLRRRDSLERWWSTRASIRLNGTSSHTRRRAKRSGWCCRSTTDSTACRRKSRSISVYRRWRKRRLSRSNGTHRTADRYPCVDGE